MGISDNGNSLHPEIAGMELSRRYYNEIGRPVIREMFPAYFDKIAAGLVGEGSECFGYDDRISRDHDFRASFCIWLPSKEYAEIGREMQEAYNLLPIDFMGVKPKIQRPQADGRRGILNTESFYRNFLGPQGVPKTIGEWLKVPEHFLAVATNGEVFEDNLGDFTKIRKQLLDFYPEDVRLQKIAARLITMAFSGQCNYSRMMRRHDVVAAHLALDEFIRAAISAVYLLNRKYTPYYKWMWMGLEKMERLTGVRKLLADIAAEGLSTGNWRTEDWEKYQYELNSSDKVVNCIERICGLVINELKEQGISNGTSDYLEEHAYAVKRCIKNESLRNLPILVS